MPQGRIIELQKSVYVVDTPQGVVSSVLKGTLKGERVKPYVGDSVEIDVRPDASPPGVITALLPRRNVLRRPLIANVDQALFLLTMREPAVEVPTIDRFLVSAEAHELASVLVFNKSDLLDSRDQQAQAALMALYTKAGYCTLAASAASGQGLGQVREALLGHVSTLAGVSGVGKSTLLQQLFPGQDFVTAEVSLKTGRGVHTTSVTRLLRLAAGSYVADTPGFVAVDLPDMDSRDIALCFPEIKALTGRCQFNDCRHDGEPGCAVAELARQGAIAASRYEHYLLFMNELRSQERRTPQARNQ